jgi:NitT/TauT family transport system permease protein
MTVRKTCKKQEYVLSGNVTRREPAYTATAVVQNCALICAIVLLWQLLPSVKLIRPSLLPPFAVVFHSLRSICVSGAILPHLLVSIRRVLTGLSLAIAFGIPVGIGIGYFHGFSEIASPLINVCRQIPPLALFPVFLLFLGIGEPSKIAIIFWLSVWSILLNTISGVRQVDGMLIKAARSMGADNMRILRTVILPDMIPSVMTGIRLGAGGAILALVAAEMIGAKSGLGFMVINSQYNFQIKQMYAYILSIAFLGLALNQLFETLERKLTFWNQPGNDS